MCNYWKDKVFVLLVMQREVYDYMKLVELFTCISCLIIELFLRKMPSLHFASAMRLITRLYYSHGDSFVSNHHHLNFLRGSDVIQFHLTPLDVFRQ